MQTVNSKFFPISNAANVLDLGAGEGRHSLNIWYLNNVMAVAGDYSLESLQTIQSKQEELSSGTGKLYAIRLDGCKLPFADGSFERIICSEVLEHIPDCQAVLSEIRRVLAPGGLLCVSVPRSWPEKLCWLLSSEYSAEPGGHIRIFRANDLQQRIERKGFKCYKKHYAHALHSPLWWLKCLFWRRRNTALMIRIWHRFLVWDLLQRPFLTRFLEWVLNPLMGKSVVLYFRLQMEPL